MAAAAQAAAIAGNPLMDGHLFNVLGIDHQPLWAKLILAGFTDEIDTLTTKQDAFATNAWSGIRKGGGLRVAYRFQGVFLWGCKRRSLHFTSRGDHQVNRSPKAPLESRTDCQACPVGLVLTAEQEAVLPPSSFV